MRTLAQVAAACGDDDLVMWAAQDLSRGRVWACGDAGDAGDAVVAACPGLARRDRMAVWGDAAGAARLVEHALGELGPSFRPLGEADLVAAVASKVAGLVVAGAFSWMSLARAPAGGATGGVGWLPPQAEGEVAALLARHAPQSYAVPGMAGVARWAGVRVGGELASVAAEAWSAPSVGLVAGVATVAAYRGRGLAERVCRWVAGELVARYGRAALMVDDDNAAALRVYGRLGFTRRRIAAAALAA
ncbi:GNAT family N-acetyltransferase [Thermoactinospora rubra]|uniref:GNAT family N-acetyltransferase n=1 Tax=Thermoactinospora rubra TaxID=1088767 RepID=UPI00198223A2|nr:GNAT family N-acetyltransferase [Thermoactinospora rubra]